MLPPTVEMSRRNKAQAQFSRAREQFTSDFKYLKIVMFRTVTILLDDHHSIA